MSLGTVFSSTSPSRLCALAATTLLLAGCFDPPRSRPVDSNGTTAGDDTDEESGDLVCEPSCAPGEECAFGTCVPVAECSPACAADEECVDGVCVSVGGTDDTGGSTSGFDDTTTGEPIDPSTSGGSTGTPSDECQQIGVHADCTYRIWVKGSGDSWHEDGTGDQLVSTRFQVNDSFARFHFDPQDDGSFQIRVVANGRHLHEDASVDRLLSTRFQPNDAFTRFFLDPVGDGSFQIRVAAHGRHLQEDAFGDQLISTRFQTDDEYTHFFIEPAP